MTYHLSSFHSPSPSMAEPSLGQPSAPPLDNNRGLSSQARWAHMLPWRLFACRHMTQFWPRRCEHRSVDGPLGKGLYVLRDPSRGQGAFSLHVMLPGSGAGNCCSHPENVREMTTEEEGDGHSEKWSHIKICHLVSHPTLDSRLGWITHFHILWPLRAEFPVICSPDHLNWYTWRDPGLGMLTVTCSN